MSLHPLQKGFQALSWKQCVDLIRGKYVQEVEHLRQGRSDQSDVFEDDNEAYAVLEAFWYGEYEQVRDNGTVMEKTVPRLWEGMTDRLSECFSTLTDLLLAVC